MPICLYAYMPICLYAYMPICLYLRAGRKRRDSVRGASGGATICLYDYIPICLIYLY